MLVSGKVQTPTQNIELAVTITLPLSEWQRFSDWFRASPQNGGGISTYPAWAIVAGVESVIRKITGTLAEPIEDIEP